MTPRHCKIIWLDTWLAGKASVCQWLSGCHKGLLGIAVLCHVVRLGVGSASCWGVCLVGVGKGSGEAGA